ncbi:MAG: hypothetical protein ACO3I0_10670 [Limisphaerales bacterium]
MKLGRQRIWWVILTTLAAIVAVVWWSRWAGTPEVPPVSPQVVVPPPEPPRPPEPRPVVEPPTYLTYETESWRRILPEPTRRPEEVRKAFDDLLLAMAFDRSSAGRNAGAGVPGVPQPRPVDLQSEWRSADQRRFEDNWNHFLRTQVDPLVVESDGLGFFDPSQIPVNSPMPIRLPKAYGFGLRFRMSF